MSQEYISFSVSLENNTLNHVGVLLREQPIYAKQWHCDGLISNFPEAAERQVLSPQREQLIDSYLASKLSGGWFWHRWYAWCHGISFESKEVEGYVLKVVQQLHDWTAEQQEARLPAGARALISLFQRGVLAPLSPLLKNPLSLMTERLWMIILAFRDVKAYPYTWNSTLERSYNSLTTWIQDTVKTLPCQPLIMLDENKIQHIVLGKKSMALPALRAAMNEPNASVEMKTFSAAWDYRCLLHVQRGFHELAQGRIERGKKMFNQGFQNLFSEATGLQSEVQRSLGSFLGPIFGGNGVYRRHSTSVTLLSREQRRLMMAGMNIGRYYDKQQTDVDKMFLRCRELDVETGDLTTKLVLAKKQWQALCETYCMTMGALNFQLTQSSTRNKQDWEEVIRQFEALMEGVKREWMTLSVEVLKKQNVHEGIAGPLVSLSAVLLYYRINPNQAQIKPVLQLQNKIEAIARQLPENEAVCAYVKELTEELRLVEMKATSHRDNELTETSCLLGVGTNQVYPLQDVVSFSRQSSQEVDHSNNGEALVTRAASQQPLPVSQSMVVHTVPAGERVYSYRAQRAYELLEVSLGATEQELAHALRMVSLKKHPDRIRPGSIIDEAELTHERVLATIEFQYLQEEYEYLTSSEKRLGFPLYVDMNDSEIFRQENTQARMRETKHRIAKCDLEFAFLKKASKARALALKELGIEIRAQQERFRLDKEAREAKLQTQEAKLQTQEEQRRIVDKGEFEAKLQTQEEQRRIDKEAWEARLRAQEEQRRIDKEAREARLQAQEEQRRIDKEAWEARLQAHAKQLEAFMRQFPQPLSNAEVQPNASLQEDGDAMQAPAANSNTSPNSPTQIVTHSYPRPGSPRGEIVSTTEAVIPATNPGSHHISNTH